MCTSDTRIVVATNSTCVLPMCSGGVATNSTCVSGAPRSCLNSTPSVSCLVHKFYATKLIFFIYVAPSTKAMQ